MRKQLALSSVSDVQTYEVQKLINAMNNDGYSASTVALERSILRTFFNYTKNQWRWPEPVTNPAVKITMPKIDNARTRIISVDEWIKIGKYLLAYNNPEVFPLVCLLLETAMRVGEPLMHARWDDIDWKNAFCC